MYIAVRAGALPWYPFAFRWGYGWDWPRCYDTANSEQSEAGEAALPNAAAQPRGDRP